MRRNLSMNQDRDQRPLNQEYSRKDDIIRNNNYRGKKYIFIKNDINPIIMKIDYNKDMKET